MFGFVFHIYQLVLLNVLLFQIHALCHAACVADMTALQVVGTLCAVQADFSGAAVELADDGRLFLAILFAVNDNNVHHIRNVVVDRCSLAQAIGSLDRLRYRFFIDIAAERLDVGALAHLDKLANRDICSG